VHDNATQADACSTALLCSGYEQGMAIATAQDLAVLFICQIPQLMQKSRNSCN